MFPNYCLKMAILSAVIVPAKVLRDGRHKVRIAVAHNSQTRYILTDVIIDSIKEFKNGSVIKRPDAAYLNTKIRKILQSTQEAIDSIEFSSSLSCSELIFHMKQSKSYSSRTLQSIVKEMSLIKNCDATKRAFLAAWNSISQIINPDMHAAAVTPAIVESIQTSLRRKGLREATVSTYMCIFKGILNFAVKMNYAEYKTPPFTSSLKFKLIPRPSWVSVEDIKRIRDLKIDPRKKRLKRVHDLFMLSYYLGGINYVDLLKITFNISSRFLRYEREKTKRHPKINPYVEFSIPDEAIEILDRILWKDGKIHMNIITLRNDMNVYMKKLRKMLDLPQLVYYSARKSFAQHAFELGVPAGVIDYILGHSLGTSKSCIYSYVYVTPDMATAAIRKVLDNLK